MPTQPLEAVTFDVDGTLYSIQRMIVRNFFLIFLS